MKVAVKLFAVARQLAGCDIVVVELPERATVAELRRQLIDEVPALSTVISHIRFAVGTDYATDATVIALGADIACIPPVSGG